MDADPGLKLADACRAAIGKLGYPKYWPAQLDANPWLPRGVGQQSSRAPETP